MKRATGRPVLITDAEKSQDEQLHSREIRYATMMGLRVVCLITGAVLVLERVPLLWLWLPLCIAGMVLLPWMAVLIANDRPPKQEYRLVNRFRRNTVRDEPAPEPAVLPPAPDRVIDPD